MSKCVDAVNSKWKIKSVELSSWVQIIANEGAGSKCLDVVVGADIVQLWSCAPNQNNQMFEVSQDGYILVKSSGKCLGFWHQQEDRRLPAEGVGIVVVDCHLKGNLKWTYLTAEKETPHFNILKPQVASDALTSELDDAQDESESDTFLDTLRKFLLLLSLLFFVAFCAYAIYFVANQSRIGQRKKHDEAV